MINIIITNKSTREERVLCMVPSVDAAERLCELWGWSYDDGACSYWMRYEEE